VCLRDGIGISKDLKGAAHHFKLSADQGNAYGQLCYGVCLRDGIGISKDLKGAVHYLKLSADQGNADGQCQWGISLLTGKVVQRDLATAIQYFKMSAEKGSPEGQTVVGWMIENGVGTPMDLIAAVGYCDLSSDQSPNGAALFGQCYQTGRGIPVDFTLAAEYFQKPADSDNPVGSNDFGCCLERGEGVDKDIDRAVRYYRKAASQSHPAGLYNFGRCLEYGKGIEQNLIRAAKYYCLSAELNEPSAENSFGICLERGIGVHTNLTLAAHYYQRAAAHGDPDGANNFGFCLEHGRGVEQNIEAAAECYKFARDHRHSEAVLDRSSKIADSRPLDDHLAHLFIDCLKDPNVSPELIHSIQRLKATMPSGPKLTVKAIADKLRCETSSHVKLTVDSNGNLTVVKTVSDPHPIERIEREATIHKMMNHPLIVKYFPTPLNQSPAIITEFALNGSLRNHLSDHNNPDFSLLNYPTKIAKIIAGIVLAMRYIHSKGVIHRNLTPDNILLDCNWKVRIADFGRSTLTNTIIPPDEKLGVDGHYLAPECYDGKIGPENDIFSFGLILYELVVRKPVFSESWTQEDVVGEVVLRDSWRDIPDYVFPKTAELIRDCWTANHWERPCFSEILDRLEEMRFKLIEKVNSSQVMAFVKEIKEWETTNLQ
jgi:TPR repeat protein/serine/threonine protein kinase